MSGVFRVNMTGMASPVWVVRFIRTWEPECIMKDGKRVRNEAREIRIVTTLDNASVKTLYRIICARWDIENAVFQELKTNYHIDHSYCHAALKVILLLQILAFDLRQGYLLTHRCKDFRRCGLTFAKFREFMWKELLQRSMHDILYQSST